VYDNTITQDEARIAYDETYREFMREYDTLPHEPMRIDLPYRYRGILIYAQLRIIRIEYGFEDIKELIDTPEEYHIYKLKDILRYTFLVIDDILVTLLAKALYDYVQYLIDRMGSEEDLSEVSKMY